ncbi:kinase-like domain-containing protein [Elsinoe ampelina]|uniref:Kinase-like domain-containing protein n=1 Tax=Elsinoe ampelina TaxID=302913 RepID=A0A6A6GIM1_9PEZI|nr:kinase-like domain-containing protein [Elsinoe ampelina]
MLYKSCVRDLKLVHSNHPHPSRQLRVKHIRPIARCHLASRQYTTNHPPTQGSSWTVFPVYKHVPGNTESPSDYHPHGFHPVHLGDVLGSRYHILHKLGHGKSATVWLAKQINTKKYVALKIARAYDSDLSEREGRILASLTNDERARGLVATGFVEAFDHEGPNGRHHVLVMEVGGQTLGEYQWDLQYRINTGRERYDYEYMRRLAVKMIQAVRYVHAGGFVHRDVQLGNFMFALDQSRAGRGIDRALAARPRTYDVEREDGKPLGRHCPAYLIEPISLESTYTGQAQPAQLGISDFGSASTIDYAGDGGQTYPLILRAPELLLADHMDEKADIWALGGAIYRLMTFRDLFSIDQYLTDDEQKTEQLQSMVEVLGPPRAGSMRDRLQQLDIIDGEGHLTAARRDDPMSYTFQQQMEQYKSMTRHNRDTAPFEDFVRYLFSWDQVVRPSADDLLRHPWAAVVVDTSGEIEQ